MIQVDPAALSPGEFSEKIRSTVEHKNTRMVVIDSLTGYLNSMPDARFLTLQLHELFTFLSQEGIVTIMILAQHGLIGNMTNQIDLSYLADTVLLLRYFESMGSVRQAISVIKKRNGGHERTIRELSISPSGIRVGKPLEEFQGVLTGVPTFVGKSLAAMSNETITDGALVK
jgi:circadian clock protein KaiC